MKYRIQLMGILCQNFVLFWELNIKHPMVVEIIDEESKLKAFVREIKSDLNSMGKGFLITLEPVDILMDIQGTP